MQTILSDRIVSDGISDNRVAIPFFAWEDEILLGVSEEEECSLFSSESDIPAWHIGGITLSDSCDRVRDVYGALGYFRAAINRFEPDFMASPITLGCYFENLFSEKNGFPQRHTGHQKALRKAVNSGVISTLSFRKTDEEYLEKAIMKLMASEEFSLFRLGRILCYNKEEIWTGKKGQDAAPFRKWITLEIPKPLV